jgi:hypothetical protein
MTHGGHNTTMDMNHMDDGHHTTTMSMSHSGGHGGGHSGHVAFFSNDNLVPVLFENWTTDEPYSALAQWKAERGERERKGEEIKD